jgi:hypothetical protein
MLGGVRLVQVLQDLLLREIGILIFFSHSGHPTRVLENQSVRRIPA